MREIKFRGKRVDNNEWVYGNLIYDNITDKYWIDLSINESEKIEGGLHIYAVEVIPETVGQYTGLHDKNGKEIYEGDIVAEYGHYVNSDKVTYQQIQWKENYSCWLIGEYQRLTPKNIERYKIVVVGNIYEDSDLLKD